MLRNNTEYFNENPVELIEAGPGASGGKTSEESTYQFYVKTFTTVEDNALDSKGL